VTSIIQDFSDALFGGDADWASTLLDLTNDANEIWLDDVERLYEISSLKNKWLDAIDSTDSVKA
jgi:hypothetical protein